MLLMFMDELVLNLCSFELECSHGEVIIKLGRFVLEGRIIFDEWEDKIIFYSNYILL